MELSLDQEDEFERFYFWMWLWSNEDPYWYQDYYSGSEQLMQYTLASRGGRKPLY